MSETTISEPLGTLAFEEFWHWVVRHPNCILRAGTTDAILFDDDDLHWHFAADGPGLYVQVLRGKRLLGEIAFDPELISYVQVYGEEPEGEHAFELVVDSTEERLVAYFFVLAHAFEDESGETGRSIH